MEKYYRRKRTKGEMFNRRFGKIQKQAAFEQVRRESKTCELVQKYKN